MLSEQLLAGAGRAAIRFPHLMFPFSKLAGVHDAPHVRILLLQSGIRFALVSIELIDVNGILERIKKIVSETADVPPNHIWVQITNPVSTPNLFSDGRVDSAAYSENDPEKREMFLSSVDRAVRQAAERAVKLKHVKCGGTGSCSVGRNRDVETAYGWWIGRWWTNIGERGATNPQMTILRFTAEDEKPVAYLVSYGMKPRALGMADKEYPQDRMVSSDITGVLSTRMEEEFGAPCLFCVSAAGNQIPRGIAFSDYIDSDGHVNRLDLGMETGYKIPEELGDEFARTAIGIASSITASEPATSLPRICGVLDCDCKEGRLPEGPEEKLVCAVDHHAQLRTEALRLGEELALVAIPAEPNVQTELELWERSPFRHTLILSMTNGNAGLMPERRAYDCPTWEAIRSEFMPGMAEKWVDMATGQLETLKNESS